MKYPLELELRQYRQAVAANLSNSTRQQARMLSRHDDGLTALIGGLDFVGTGLARIDRSLEDIATDLAGIEGGLNEISTDLARLVATFDWALPSIVEYLAINAKKLKKISKMMATPEETRAAERFRAGTIALANAQKAGSSARIQKWYALAVRDLRQAVTIHEYHPKSWFNLGIALERLGQTVEAAEAFTSSAFFSVDRSLEFGATAVLIAAGLYRKAGLSDKSAEILQEYLLQLDRCAEVHLALAVHHNAPGELQRALELWPFLAVDALAAKAADVEQISADICNTHSSSYSRLHHLWKAMADLYTAISDSRLQGISPMPEKVRLPTQGLEALILAAGALPVTVDQAKRLVAEVKTSLGELQAIDPEAAPIVAQIAELERSLTSCYTMISRMKISEHELSCDWRAIPPLMLQQAQSATSKAQHLLDEHSDKVTKFYQSLVRYDPWIQALARAEQCRWRIVRARSAIDTIGGLAKQPRHLEPSRRLAPEDPAYQRGMQEFSEEQRRFRLRLKEAEEDLAAATKEFSRALHPCIALRGSPRQTEGMVPLGSSSGQPQWSKTIATISGPLIRSCRNSA